jgi:glycosyltransferase involved in cell wall biosynthesis
LEAMAAGLPVAATDVGDVRAMLDSANDLYVVPKDAAALTAALAGLLADAPRRVAIGAANRAKAARDFDQEVMFQAYAVLFDG